MPGVSPRGTYLVISEALGKGIKEGEIAGALPSEADLGGVYGVSRNTVRRALKVLEAEGLIRSVPGVGWRVSQGGGERTLAALMTDLIAEDALAIGDAYPSETKLCERFGASRTAVRRVLARMEGSGLLDTVHGKGRAVRALPGSAGQS
ncbi:GntR family transcriptional regulator [Streptomyces sp. NPDC048577]|uniref:GntR family transcriptional regulator n=1 Tax=Streptomyces sp. NPDC048577 TaxID=3157209 RepID=UPI00341DF250